ncbi:4-alpha-glucanotransferase [Arthrobacter sp. 260]|uniref:4-alpha-glucanotransferase n=1 Tax=Arthrobacter sp. 260 TaxID=2735314 RepID=UPI001492A53C|nr:4-alpha-glucanotransferase [Arthrobacter sp. 260]NOJ58838.1 4-alpha-glucanotransferase [Arthrobacter sp. 260]
MPATEAPPSSTPPEPDLLHRLAEAHHVGTAFRGWDGTEKSVSPQTLTKVLTALGVACETGDEATRSLTESERAPWRRTLPPVVVGREAVAQNVPVTVPAGTTPTLRVVLEDGGHRDLALADVPAEHAEVDGEARERVHFALPADLPLGWHTLHAGPVDDDDAAQCTLVITPQRLDTTARLTRTWGLMAQLYSVRSADSWGIGDIADLRELAAFSASRGAGFVLINPLHAAEPAPPVEPSPYLPSTRRFFNPLYLRVEEVPEFAALTTEQRHAIEQQAVALKQANQNAEILDRDSSYAAKLSALEAIHQLPLTAERQRSFEEFLSQEGPGLDSFALWCALAETLAPGAAEWDDPDYIEAQRAELADRIRFHLWLQWLCDEQLAAAQRGALDAGMTIGIIHDLAVGVHAHGSDAWSLRGVLADGISVGAPPDMFNQQGQDWSQPPWHPGRLAESGYAPYRDMLRTVLKHAGGIRVDHILGLFRLWWIPAGGSSGDGTYVYYDHEALIGILALEAQRAGAVVIGEDLGVFEPGVQDYLAERGILGTSILWFEHDDGGPRRPENYRQACLTSVTTHDLPPTAGYLAGEHVDLRESLGLLNRPVEEERAADQVAQESVLSLVRSVTGPTAEGSAGTVEETVEALHRFIVRTPSVLLGVALTDAVGERRTQNQPGTKDEYPNWRIPLAGPDGKSVLIDDLPGSERFAALARVMAG